MSASIVPRSSEASIAHIPMQEGRNAAAAKSGRVTSMLPRPPETFLGRESELRRLLSSHPRRRLVFLKGLAGIGKTALALSFMQRLRETHPDLAISCVRCLEGQTFDDVAAEVDSTDASADAGSRVVPSALRDRMLGFVQRLNEGRRLLFLDDVHVLPEHELAMLLRLLQSYLEAHVLMTSRREPPLPAVETIDILQEKLGGLSDHDADDLVSNLLALHGRSADHTEGRLEQLVRDAAGHPFLLRLLASLAVTRSLDVASFKSGSSAALRQWLLGSVLGEVDENERALLETIATARVPLPAGVLGVVTEHADVRKTVEALERKFLVERESHDQVRIHQVLAEHVRGEMDADRQRDLHAALTHALRDAGLPEQAFHHAVEAGRLDDAAALLTGLAGRLCSRGQYVTFLDEVKRLASAGAAIPPTVRLMQANALSVTGRGADGLAILRDLQRTIDDADVIADALTTAGGTHLNSGQYLPAIECYREALTLCDGDEPRPALFKCLNYLGLIHGYRGEMRVAFEHLRRSEALARRHDLPAARAHTVRIQATLHALIGAFEEARIESQEALSLALSLDAVRVVSFARYAAALAHIGLHNNAEARDELMIMLAHGQQHADLHVQAYAHLEIAQVSCEEGDFETASSGFLTAIRKFQEQGDGLGVAMAEVRLARLRLDQGRLDEVVGLAARAADAARERGNPRLETEARLVMAEHALESGALARAHEEAEAALRLLDPLDLPFLTDEATVCLAEAQARNLRWTQVRETLAPLGQRQSRTLAATRQAQALEALIPGGVKGRAATRSDTPPLRAADARRLQRFERRLASATARQYRVITSEGDRVVTEPEAIALRGQADSFDFFLDAPERALKINGKGDVPVFRKRVISRLLVVLVAAGERGLSTEELVPRVWGYPYEDAASALEVRKAVSRLRELIEADRAKPRIILHHDGVAGGPGRYRFNAPPSTCAILETADNASAAKG